MVTRPKLLVGLVSVVVVAVFYIRRSLGDLFYRIDLDTSHFVTFLSGVLLIPGLKQLTSRIARAQHEKRQTDNPSTSVYGLDHGRLHVRLPLPMWMNMGYWRQGDERDEHVPKSMAAASRDLLLEVFKTAGFSDDKHKSTVQPDKPTTKILFDLGFGCGDQTVYLMSSNPIRESDREWWDDQNSLPRFDSYIGITLDRKQFQYAQERIQELRNHYLEAGRREKSIKGMRNTKIFCADAANPVGWDDKLASCVRSEAAQAEESWVLALDTLYHFFPSRWPIFRFAYQNLNASCIAFDLCLADHVSLANILLLRMVTRLMGAPWANFVTRDGYRAKLVEAGYRDIIIRDISAEVFAPLANFLEDQDRKLGMIGYGLGPFHVARWMFKWWAQTGIVRGVIVVARRRPE